MENVSLTDEILKSLSFEIEAIPKIEPIAISKHRKNVPVDVKIRVKKKKENLKNDKNFSRIVEVNTNRRVRLVSSDQTIASFNMLLETDQEVGEKEKLETKKQYVKRVKPGGCLDPNMEDHDGPYLPSSSTTKAKRTNSDNILIKQNALTPKISSLSKTRPKSNKSLFGKCKPGGCLDPFADEDEFYSYAPKLNKTINTLKSKTRKQSTRSNPSVGRVKQSLGSTVGSDCTHVILKKDNEVQQENRGSFFSGKIFRKKKSSCDIYIEHLNTDSQVNSSEGDARKSRNDNIRNSIITYPPEISKSDININSDKSTDVQLKTTQRSSIENEKKQSIEILHAYFVPPKSYSKNEGKDKKIDGQIIVTSEISAGIAPNYETINNTEAKTNNDEENAKASSHISIKLSKIKEFQNTKASSQDITDTICNERNLVENSAKKGVDNNDSILNSYQQNIFLPLDKQISYETITVKSESVLTLVKKSIDNLQSVQTQDYDEYTFNQDSRVKVRVQKSFSQDKKILENEKKISVSQRTIENFQLPETNVRTSKIAKPQNVDDETKEKIYQTTILDVQTTMDIKQSSFDHLTQNIITVKKESGSQDKFDDQTVTQTGSENKNFDESNNYPEISKDKSWPIGEVSVEKIIQRPVKNDEEHNYSVRIEDNKHQNIDNILTNKIESSQPLNKLQKDNEIIKTIVDDKKNSLISLKNRSSRNSSNKSNNVQLDVNLYYKNSTDNRYRDNMFENNRVTSSNLHLQNRQDIGTASFGTNSKREEEIKYSRNNFSNGVFEEISRKQNFDFNPISFHDSNTKSNLLIENGQKDYFHDNKLYSDSNNENDYIKNNQYHTETKRDFKDNTRISENVYYPKDGDTFEQSKSKFSLEKDISISPHISQRQEEGIKKTNMLYSSSLEEKNGEKMNKKLLQTVDSGIKTITTGKLNESQQSFEDGIYTDFNRKQKISDDRHSKNAIAQDSFLGNNISIDPSTQFDDRVMLKNFTEEEEDSFKNDMTKLSSGKNANIPSASPMNTKYLSEPHKVSYTIPDYLENNDDNGMNKSEKEYLRHKNSNSNNINLYNNEKNLQNKTDSVILNLSIQSYNNEIGDRIIKSIDPENIPQKYKNDTITTFQTPTGINTSHITLHLDHDDQISMTYFDRTQSKYLNLPSKTVNPKQISYDLKLLDVRPDQEIKKKGEVNQEHTQHNVFTVNHPTEKLRQFEEEKLLRKTLSSIYEEELIPLKETIKKLKEDIDCLASKQMSIRGRLITTKKKSTRLVRANRHCYCNCEIMSAN